MKITIKLLIILLLVVVGMSSFINYSLAKEYKKIDLGDKFYEYDKCLDLKMDAIKIIGGNKSNVKIEKGESNAIFIHKRMIEGVNFSTNNNILTVSFDSYFTDSIESPERINNYNRTPRVIITYNDVNQVSVLNSRLTLDCGVQGEVDVTCKGRTIMAININGSTGGKLNLDAAGQSRVKIMQVDSASIMEYANIKLTGETFLKVNQFRPDSLTLSMGNSCRIDCDNDIFRQLRSSLVTE